MRKEKSKGTFFLSLLHVVTIVAIVFVFIFATNSYIVRTILGIDTEYSFYDLLRINDDTLFRTGVAILVLLSFAAFLTLGTLLSGLTKGRKGINYFSIFIGVILAITAILIFRGYENYLNQLVEQNNLGNIVDSIFGSSTTLEALKEIYTPETGYYLMGVACSVGAFVEILIGVLNLKVKQ